MKTSLTTRRIAFCLALLCSAATPVHAQEPSAAVEGRPVFALPAPGPIVNSGLSDSRYPVAANLRGQTDSRSVTLCGNDSPKYFHWQGGSRIELPVAPAVGDGAAVE
jgi:hypothetical protein